MNLLGAGGQGEVYDVECDGKHYALKWYFKGSATARQKKLLEEIIAKGAPDSSFLWPMELIVPSQGNLFGYIMPLRPKNYKSIVDLMKNRVNPSFYVICRTAFNLTKGYRNLHIAGAKYQDISFGNLFFNPDNGDVLICDNDNVSYGNSKPGGVLGTPGFMAPEIVRGEARPSRDTDRYSLAVLLFYLFMVNHPLEGKQEASIKCMDVAARVKLYGTDPIFIFDPDNKTNRPVPGIHDNANIYWPLYPEQLRQLFIKSFTVGLNNPSKTHSFEDEMPKCISLKDNYFERNRLTFRSRSQLIAYITQEIEQGRNKLYFRIDGLFPKLRRSELAGMVAKIAAGGQSRAVKVQQIPNEKVGTYWIRIY